MELALWSIASAIGGQPSNGSAERSLKTMSPKEKEKMAIAWLKPQFGPRWRKLKNKQGVIRAWIKYHDLDLRAKEAYFAFLKKSGLA